MHATRAARVVPLLLLSALGCRRSEPAPQRTSYLPPAESVYTVRDTMLPQILEASGVAEPVRRASLGTRLMGTVTEVLVHEGDAVRAGQLLARVDARDLAARGTQARASVREAEAVLADAETQAARMRALYADSAAPKAQLDAAETGLARARAGLAAAQAAVAEVQAMTAYAEVRAPFDGIVTRRVVDPGAFAAPGTELLMLEDASRLRISVTAPPSAARAVRRGMRLEATIEGAPATAVVEGVVPVSGSALYAVNALVDNASRDFLAGSAATLALRQGERRAVLVPSEAIVSQGDLTGVRVVTGAGPELRWVRVGRMRGDAVEVLSGLQPGERVLLAAARPSSAS